MLYPQLDPVNPAGFTVNYVDFIPNRTDKYRYSYIYIYIYYINKYQSILFFFQNKFYIYLNSNRFSSCNKRLLFHSDLLTRANEYLASNPGIKAKSCESHEINATAKSLFKSDLLVDEESSSYYEYETQYSHFLRGLRFVDSERIFGNFK